MKIGILISIFILTSCLTIKNRFKEVNLKEVNFESIFGVVESNPDNIYCLLGTGFFRTPRSDNSDSLINDWILFHPKAIVVPICSHGPIMIDSPDSKMIYCWVIDQKDTLNSYLIREGCFPGGTMIRPKTWEEMEEWEKELYDGLDDKPNVQVLANENDYDTFVEQIKVAELYARREKIGIWKTDE